MQFSVAVYIVDARIYKGLAAPVRQTEENNNETFLAV